MKSVSIIIPVYNVLPYLEEALDSAVNQTYNNLEIIIVDDGSTDGSGLLCDKYAIDPRVKVVHQENHGLSGARNTGLDMATGDYVAFLDSDDAFLPDMVQIMVEGIEKSKADLAVCGFETIYSEKNMSKHNPKRRRDFHADKEETLSREGALNHITDKITAYLWNKLYKIELWDDLRFPEGRFFEDVWVVPDMFERVSRVHIIPNALIMYRKRVNSITSATDEKIVSDDIDARIRLEDYIKRYSSKMNDDYALNRFYENNTRLLTICYSELLHLKNKNEDTDNLKNMLLDKWSSLDGKLVQFKSKLICYMFRHIPSLIYPVSSSYRIIQRFL